MRRFPAKRKKGRMPYIIMIILTVIMAATRNQKVQDEKIAVTSTLKEQIITGSTSFIEGVYSPVLEFAKQSDKEVGFLSWLKDVIFAPMPILAYAEEEKQIELVRESEGTKNRLLSMAKTEDSQEEIPEIQVSSNNELMALENQSAEREFQMPKEKLFQYDFKEIPDYESLINQFYIVDVGTAATEELINYQALAEPDMSIEVNTQVPQILIYHTHSNETFADSVPGDDNTSIIGVGAKLAECLRAYGYNVLHHTAEYDAVRDDAYGVALPEIEKLLQENPSIEVVIDLHRDQVAEGTKLVTDVQGRPTAQIMFFNGLSRTRDRGEIAYLENPNIAQNLAFSFQMQVAANEYYPGLTRRIYLKGYRYNMHLKPKYLLVEMGAQNNTVEEMKNACDPLAHLLYLVLTGQNKQ